MRKDELKKVLERYTKSLIGASGETIITNYGKMRDFTKGLDEKELGEELCNLCNYYTIHQALKAVEKEKVSLKSCSTDWNSRVVAKGYQLAKECKQIYREQGLSQGWKAKMLPLGEMAIDETSIATQLCLMGLFFQGKALTDEGLARLKELLSDDPKSMK